MTDAKPIALARSLSSIALRCVAAAFFGAFALASIQPAYALARPGDIIESHPIAAPIGASGWSIRYRSTGLHGESIPVTGLAYAPQTPVPPGGRPVVAWAHPTTGIADACAPSLHPNGYGHVPSLETLLKRGYVVVETDYPGLGTPGPHPYMVGVSEARAVVDSVRAAIRLTGTGAGRRFVAWGHSQGGQAVLFTGQIAAAYAPELSLVGVAAIAPPTDLATLVADDLTERAGRVLTSYAVWSWSHVFGYDMRKVVDPRAVWIVDTVARECILTNLQSYRVAFVTLGLTSRFVSDNVYRAPPWSTQMAANDATAMPASIPLLVAQGQSDIIVRPATTQRYVSAACKRGQKVDFLKVPGGHLGAATATAASAIAWIAQRFAHAPPPSTCPH